MSEYQCYEFVALDRPLTTKEMAELRSISTRAEITPTRFWNEYEWGDLKADAGKLLARYFDAHLYVANWGTRRFMLRLPARSVEVAALRPYFSGRRAKLTQLGAFVVLDFWSDDEDHQEDWVAAGGLAALTPIRAQLLRGDFRAAYVAWLCNVQAGELDGSYREPPVPAGIAEAAAPLSSLVELLRLDPHLLSTAAEASDSAEVSSKEVRAWVKARSAAEKDRWLFRAVDHPEAAMGSELFAAFRRESSRDSKIALRTVAELQARAERLRAERGARAARLGAGATVASARGNKPHAARDRGSAPRRGPPKALRNPSRTSAIFEKTQRAGLRPRLSSFPIGQRSELAAVGDRGRIDHA